MRRQRGFTLLELMIVACIIALLATISIPMYVEYLVRARVAEGLYLAGPLKDAVTAYRDRWGLLPPDNAAAGLPPPEALRGQWVQSMEVRDGLIAIRYFPLEQLGERDTLFLRPAYETPLAPLRWVCQRNERSSTEPQPVHALDDARAIEPRYIPGACK